MTITRRLFLVWPLFLVLLVGCMNSATPARVSGTVKYKGTPLTAGTVTFHPEQGGVYGAAIKPDGTYSISDLPTGPVEVAIETESANPQHVAKSAEDYAKQRGGRGKAGESMTSPRPEGVPAAAPAEKGAYVKIPAKYADRKKSQLTMAVVAGKQTKDFDLTD